MRGSTWNIVRSVTIAVFALMALCMPSCSSGQKLQASALLTHLRIGYEAYLREGGGPMTGEIDVRDFRQALMGERGGVSIQLIDLPRDSVDAEGYVIDEWKSRIMIRTVPEPKHRLEFRSAGADRTFGTRDDVHIESNAEQ